MFLPVNKKEMLETTCFRNWYYGTSIDALSEDKINIGVFKIQGIKNLLKDSDITLENLLLYKQELENSINDLIERSK